MKFIKQIETLLEKAQDNAQETGKGMAKVNGRVSYWNGEKGELEEKYSIHIHHNTLFMYHWGTQTVQVDLNTCEIVSYYGQSNSDRDSLNTLVYLLGIEPNFRWLPSKDLFIYDNKK